MKKIALVLALSVAFSFGAQTLKVKSNNTTIFSSKSGNSSKGELTKGSLVYMVKKGKDRSFVKSSTGVKGWIVNGEMEYVQSNDNGDVFNLDNQDVTGWLDNPSAVYILDNSGLNTEALPLTRNFEDEIFEKQDREDIERSNDEN